MSYRVSTAHGASLVCALALSAMASAPLSVYAQTFTYTSATGGAIPDNNAVGISSMINVSDNAVFTDFNAITINGLKHTYLGDLIITLSHSGKTVDIIDRVRGAAANGYTSAAQLSGNYTFVATGGADFNAAAAAANSRAVVPSNVSYATVPIGVNVTGGVSDFNGLLSDFAGLNVSGAWTLNISDRESADTGSFTGWQFAAERSSFINRNRTIADDLFNGFATVTVGNTADSDVTLAAGGRINQVQVFSGSRLFMNGGLATAVTAISNGSLHINAGTVLGAVTATESSTAYISGGTVGSVVTGDGAKAYVLAGTFGSVSASGNSGIFVYGGGTRGGAIFAAAGGASISLFGSNLALDAASKTRGTDGAGDLGYFYNLSGTLTDGMNLAGSRFFDADGGLSVVGENPGALYFNGVAVVPEASAGALLALAGAGGLIGIVRRKMILSH